MADQHTVVERTDSGTGVGMVLGIVVVLLVAIVALFFVFGGPGRFAGGATPASPGQTNVNVPAQNPPQSGPNVNVPPQVDVNVNQRGQAPSGGQPSNP